MLLGKNVEQLQQIGGALACLYDKSQHLVSSEGVLVLQMRGRPGKQGEKVSANRESREGVPVVTERLVHQALPFRMHVTQCQVCTLHLFAIHVFISASFFKIKCNIFWIL